MSDENTQKNRERERAPNDFFSEIDVCCFGWQCVGTCDRTTKTHAHTSGI